MKEIEEALETMNRIEKDFLFADRSGVSIFYRDNPDRTHQNIRHLLDENERKDEALRQIKNLRVDIVALSSPNSDTAAEVVKKYGTEVVAIATEALTPKQENK